MNNSHKACRSRAPMRIGLGGGGTDVNPFCNNFGSAVLNVTIAKYAHSTITNTKNEKSVLISQDRNYSEEATMKAIMNYDISNINKDIRFQVAALQYFNKKLNLRPREQIEFTSMCDTYHGSGLGASSAILVSQIKCLSKYFDYVLDDYELAEIAIQIERNICNISGGFQDQYASAFGGFNYLESSIGKSDSITVHSLKIPNWIKAELTSRMLMLHVDRINDIEEIFSDMKGNNVENILLQMKNHTINLKNQLLKGKLDEFTKIFGELWDLKQKTSNKILPSNLKSIYDFAIKNGAISGKVSGAGGGGFFVFLCNPKKKGGLIRSLQSMNSRVENVVFDELGAQSWEINDSI